MSLANSDASAVSNSRWRPKIKARFRYTVLGYSNHFDRWVRIFGQFVCYKDALEWVQLLFPSMVQTGDNGGVKIRKLIVFNPKELVLDDNTEVVDVERLTYTVLQLHQLE